MKTVRLNPSLAGTTSPTAAFKDKDKADKERLNPSLAGTTSPTGKSNSVQEHPYVLILLLLEQPLRQR